MFARVRQALLLLIVPALLVAGASSCVQRGAYALFACSMTGLTQTKCCCPGLTDDTSDQDQIARASCCEARQVEVETHRADAGFSVQPAVLSASFTRIAVRTLFRFEHVRPSFAVREAPRAIGPPLILLYRVLRL